MENNLIIKEQCLCCKNEFSELDKFCGTCGYPLKGTADEQRKFTSQYVANQHDKEFVLARIKEARIILFIIAAFTFIQSLLIYFNDSDAFLLIINLFISCVYAGLGFWATKKAFAAIFIGGIVYISIILFSAFMDPTTIFKGIIFKVIFLVAFVKAAYGSYKYKI